MSITVAALPNTPTNGQANPATVCAGGSSTLSATVGSGETVDWYTGSCGGTPVGSGVSLVVNPAGTTIYYARARNNTAGCVSASCTEVTVAVGDTAAPSITDCGPDQSTGAGENCQASVPDFTAGVTATDNCTPSEALTKTQSPVAGTLVGLGNTTVIITVKDAANNQTQCMRTFTVTNLAPQISGPNTLTVVAGSTCPNAGNELILTGTDANSPSLNWSISSPPSNGTASFVGGNIGSPVTVCYQPGGGVGSDQFTVQVSDVCGATTSSLVALTVSCPAFVAADLDHDCDVDQADFVLFQDCATGPAVPPTDPNCLSRDLDGDGYVDQSDFAIFQRCISGESNPANPDCAD